MNDFNSHTIIENNEIIAKELKRARLRKKISIEDASKQLKMNVGYLKALEIGDFDALPTGIYRHNFLREYAIFLGLSADEIVSLFLENNAQKNDDSQNKLFVKKTGHAHYFITIPKFVKNILLFSASVVCFLYLAFCINAIVSPPKLVIDSPSLDMVTKNKQIVIKGSTDPEAEVTINNELVLSDSLGVFSKKINLKKGINTIIIVSRKKYSRRNELVKKVLVNES